MRKKYKQKNKDKIYASYLTSYLIISLVPLLITFLGYLYCENIVRKEILSSQSYTLSQLQYNTDHYIKAIVDSNQSLVTNTRINALMNSYELSPSELLEVVELQKDLTSAKSNMDFCSETNVYFYRSDSIVTATRRYASPIMDLYSDSFNMSKEEFIEYIQSPNFQGYRIVETGDNEYSLFFLQNVYSYNYKEVLATIISVVPWDNLAAIVERLKWPGEGEVYWLNSENQILRGDINGINLDGFTYDYFTTEEELLYRRINNKKYVSSYLLSEQIDIKYCVTMPTKYYFLKINYMKLVIFIEIIIALGTGIAMALYYSRKNYHPISKIISLLNEKKNFSNDFITFERVEQSLSNLLSENMTLTKLMDQKDKALMNSALAGILKGWNQDEDMIKECLNMIGGHQLKDEEYIVFILKFQDIENCKLLDGISEDDKMKSYNLLQFAIQNVLEEIILSKCNGVSSNVDGMVVCILNIDDKEQREIILTEVIKRCANFYQKVFQLKVFVAASGIHKGYENLSKAYDQAIQVLSFQSFWGNDAETLVYYDESYLQDNIADGYGRQITQREGQLYNLLLAKDYKKAFELLDSIIEESFIKDVKAMDINRCRMFGLINTVFCGLSDIIGRYDESFFEKLQPLKRLLNANSISQTKKEMRDIFDEITHYLDNCMKEERPRWVLDVQKYVDEHYNDVNISISALADQFNMSLSYVGRTFKKYMGYGILDYIHMARLKDCKKRLATGESVKSVAEATGYVDSKSMIRAFKRYEGITPGQFKSNCNN